MPRQATAESNRAAGLAPTVPWRIRAFTVLPSYRLAITFNDGRQGVTDLSAVRTCKNCGVYEPLKNPKFFSQAQLELGAITWPNGADLDPSWLYEQLEQNETWSVPF